MIVCESKFVRFQLVVGRADVDEVGEAISNTGGNFEPVEDCGYDCEAFGFGSTLNQWEAKVLSAPGAPERVAELEKELRG